MVDSDALRSRRARAHRAGSHHLCRHGDARGALAAVPAGDDAAQDPEAMLAELAARLVAAHKADPGNASLARELRQTLLALAPEGGGLDPELAELFRAFRT